MNSRFNKIVLVGLLTLLGSCSTLPTGPERLALVEELVARQEYAKAQSLLVDIAEDDPAYNQLMLRREAMQPLILQFEQNVARQVSDLKAQDEWPAAENLLNEALRKLPNSAALRAEEAQFYSDRMERLQAIDREISLLRGQHLTAKTPLVQRAEDVHPRGFKTRWQSFRHGREAETLAKDLLSCGEHALEEARFDLAESCLKMALDLTGDEATALRVAELDERREQEKAEALAQAQAERKAEQAAREARRTEQVGQLKVRYRHLLDAGWLMAAREILAELQEQIPQDPEVVAWAEDLGAIIAEQVETGIKEGQSLYSQGKLHDALATWREAAKLDPQNAVLQAHIARVERFIAKLERLDKDDV